MADKHTIQGLEIFAAGTWNDDFYTEQDLQNMVDAFPAMGWKPPLKLGHQEQSGDRAFGWIQRIYRSGSKLLADIGDISDELFKLIRMKAYNAVSSEIFWNFKRAGIEYPRVLKAVALLGAETPAVDLAPVSSAILHKVPNGPAHAYIFPRKGKDMSEDPGAEFVARVDQYALMHGMDWSKAFDLIRQSEEGQRILRRYGQHHVEVKEGPLYDGQRADETIHDLAEARMAKDKALDYAQAIRNVLADDVELKAAYASKR